MEFSFPLIDKLTSNYGLSRPFTNGVFIHSTDGNGRTVEDEYQSTIRYFNNINASASSHLLIGPKEVARIVDDNNIAWHARDYNNQHFLSIEMVMPAYTNFTYTEFQYKAAAEACYKWHLAWGFPLERIDSQYEKGIIGHKDSEQGRVEKKPDPINFNWDKLFYYISQLQNQDLISLVGEGFAQLIETNPELGQPIGRIFHNPDSGDGFCWTTNDYLLVWKKSTNESKSLEWRKSS